MSSFCTAKATHIFSAKNLSVFDINFAKTFAKTVVKLVADYLYLPVENYLQVPETSVVD